MADIIPRHTYPRAPTYTSILKEDQISRLVREEDVFQYFMDF